VGDARRMRKEQQRELAASGVLPAACALATMAAAIAWSSTALLVGLAVVALAGSIDPFATRARQRAEAGAAAGAARSIFPHNRMSLRGRQGAAR
jgi:hypothetical protein